MTRDPLNIEEISREYELRYSKKNLQPLPQSRRTLQLSPSRTILQTSPLRHKVHI
jgi:hypothetical protein